MIQKNGTREQRPRPGQLDSITAASRVGPISASVTRPARSSRPVGSRLMITRAAPLWGDYCVTM